MNDQLDSLKSELKSALRSHYKRLTDTVPDIYGYSLFTEDGVSSLVPVANRTSAMRVGPSDPLYNCYRYLAVNWSEWDDFGLFSTVNRIVSEILADKSIEFAVKREAILRVGLAAMCELEAEGTFGPKSAERFLVMCLSDSDEPIMMESARLLNTPEAFAAYANEF